MKPITISAMVAGVQAGRISAVVFIVFPFLRFVAAEPRLLGIEMVAIEGGFKKRSAKTEQASEATTDF
jgi:hypothetical protein